MNMTPPCKDCKDRVSLCHSSCEKYKEWKAFIAEVNRRMREDKRNGRSFSEYIKYRG